MGLETDQAITNLASIAGCAETLQITRAFARVDIKQAIDATFKACEVAIYNWPGFSNMRWIKARREEFKSFIATQKDTGHSAVSVIYMCAQVIEDMLEEYDYSKEKLALLVPVKTEIDKLVTFCDRDGANFPAMEKAWGLIDKLYRIIGKKEMARA